VPKILSGGDKRMPEAIEGLDPAATDVSKGLDPVTTPTPVDPAGQTPKVYDEEYVKKLRKEAADNRAAVNELKKLQDEKLSADERKDKRLAELEAVEQTRAQEKRELLIRVKVTEFTADTDCLDKAWLKEKLQSYASLEMDDEDIPTDESLEKALKALRKQYVALFKPEGRQAPDATTGALANADKSTQQGIDATKVYSLTDPILWKQ
jgi:hypothetical protein